MVAQVKIACKLPNGLTVRHKDHVHVLKGANDANAVAGFGVTAGVDVDWFNDWVTTDGKDLPFIKNGSVFVMKDAAAARERKDLVTGMEPLDPDKPAPGIEPTDETKKVLAGEEV
jgi:hypothetical protein